MSPPPVAELRPLALGDVVASAALLDRVDVKYVVALDRAAELFERLRPTHGVLEIEGVRAFEYRTTYFDTVELLTYREHVQRRRRRFKCRQREYVDSGAQAFEVKLKGDRGRTIKHRLRLPPTVPPKLGEPALEFLAEQLGDRYCRSVAGELGPTLAMTYRRVTLAAPEGGERLTCDVDLAFVAPDGRAGRLAPGLAILESKSATGAALADRELRRLGVRPAAGCSKYCLGIALTHPSVKTNSFRPLLRRWFEPLQSIAAPGQNSFRTELSTS